MVSVNGVVPDPELIQDETKRASKIRALEYMGLAPDTPAREEALNAITAEPGLNPSGRQSP